MKILSWGPLLLLRTNLISVWAYMCVCCVSVCVRSWLRGCAGGSGGVHIVLQRNPACTGVDQEGTRPPSPLPRAVGQSVALKRSSPWEESPPCVKRNSADLKATLPQFAFLSAEITSDHSDLLPLKPGPAIVSIILKIWFGSKIWIFKGDVL